MITDDMILEYANRYKLAVDAVEKIALKCDNDSVKFAASCARLNHYLDSILDLYSENENSTVFKTLDNQLNSINKIKRNNINSVLRLFDYEDEIVLSKSTLLSLLLSCNSNTKSINAKPVDSSFLSGMKYLFSEISIHELEKNTKIFDNHSLLLFLKSYINLNKSNDTSLHFDKETILKYVRWISNYKLDNTQVNNIYTALFSNKDTDISLDKIFDEKQIFINESWAEKEYSFTNLNRQIILDAYGDGFYKKNFRAFSKYALSRNVDTIIDIINSDEFIYYPELASATVFSKSNIEQIRAILDIPYLKEDKYRSLICPTLFIQNPDKIETNIKMCKYFGLDDYSNNKTLVIQNSSNELLSKINFLNHFNEPLVEDEKIHPLFKCNSNKKIKAMTKKIADVELSRRELIQNFGSNYIDKNDYKNDRNHSKVLRK